MLIFPGDDDAISFNDDGSPDTRQTGSTKVHVNAQVDRSRSLDWYHKLISFFPDIPGELKSPLMLAGFRELPCGIQTSIWLNLSRVRIHIVDPRPNYRRIENILRRAWKRTDAPDVVRQMEAEGLPYARWLSAKLRELVADSILHDSTARRVVSIGRLFADPFWPFHEDETNPLFSRAKTATPLITLEDFAGQRGIVGKAASWSAKSSAAFHAALDAVNFHDATDQSPYRFDFGKAMLGRIVQELLPTHAFDKGDTKQIELLETTRHSMIDELATHDRLHGLIVKDGFKEIDSKESYYIQAADFAAGVASNIYGSEGLVGVALRFEYVTYNGRRVSLADAEDEMREQRTLDW